MNSLSKLIITALAFGGSISTASATDGITDVTVNGTGLGSLDAHSNITAPDVLNLSKPLNSLDPITLTVTADHTTSSSGNYAVIDNSASIAAQEGTDLHLPVQEPAIGIQGNVSTSSSTLPDLALNSSIGSRNLDITGALTASATPSTTFNASLDDAGFRNASTITLKEVPAIPEPETYAMLLAGLGLMGFITKRRSKPII